MKILYLCSDLGIPVLGRHGAAVHIRGLVAALQRAGHSVLLAAGLLNKSPWEEPAPLTASVLHVPPGSETSAAVLTLKAFNRTIGDENSLPGEIRRLLYNKDLARHLKSRFTNDPPDFIYERASLFGTAGVQLAQELNRPLVVEVNAPLALEQDVYREACLGKLAREAERWTLRQAGLLLVVSSALREYALDLGVDAERVHVVPNGVDPALFRPLPESQNRRAERVAESNSNGNQRALVLGFVGGLRPWHDIDALPTLLDQLGQRHENLRLVIAGDGPLRLALQTELEARGLSNRTQFLGPLQHEDIPRVIGGFDVALAPYARAQHPFYFSPLKLFEYMACGAPVVAARLGQIAEVVRDGETGLLYQAGDQDALVAACDRLLSNPALRQQLGQAAAEEVRAHYTWDHNAARVIELVRSLPKVRGARQ